MYAYRGNFRARMELAQGLAAERRGRGEMSGAAAKGWVSSKRYDSAADLDAFDHYIARVAAWVQDGSEAFAVAMLRVRESDMGEACDEIPF